MEGLRLGLFALGACILWLYLLPPTIPPLLVSVWHPPKFRRLHASNAGKWLPGSSNDLFALPALKQSIPLSSVSCFEGTKS